MNTLLRLATWKPDHDDRANSVKWYWFYLCSAYRLSESNVEYGGLSYDRYMHFSSPIKIYTVI